jgi:hypothetical protein
MRLAHAPARAAQALLMGVVWSGCAQKTSDDMVGLSAAPVIYAADDRIDLVLAPQPAQGLFQDALVALVPATRIRVLASGDALIDAQPLGVAQGLCAGARFEDEPSAAVCSGTLVGDDLVLTARHCVTSLEQCRLSRWVFGYAYAQNGELVALGPDNLYDCKRIVAGAFDRSQNLDFAWVELDRPVRGRRPLPALALNSPLAPGSRLVAAGFGQGVPAKFDPNVEVLASFENYFTATVDAFTGSSGMPVMTTDATLVGFTLRGEDDYVTVGGCKAPQVLGKDCEGCAFGGETVAHLGPALAALQTARIGGASDAAVDTGFDAGVDASVTTSDPGVPSEEGVMLDAGPPGDAGLESNREPSPGPDSSTGQDAATIPYPNQAIADPPTGGEPPSVGSQTVGGLSCTMAHVQGRNQDDSAGKRWCWVFVAMVAWRRRAGASSGAFEGSRFGRRLALFRPPRLDSEPNLHQRQVTGNETAILGALIGFEDGAELVYDLG